MRAREMEGIEVYEDGAKRCEDCIGETWSRSERKEFISRGYELPFMLGRHEVGLIKLLS